MEGDEVDPNKGAVIQEDKGKSGVKEQKDLRLKTRARKKEKEMPSFEAYAEGDDLSEYLDRFESYLEVNEIESDRATSHLLCHGGKILYKKISIVTAPSKPPTVAFTELKKKLLNLTDSTMDPGVARQNFYARVQNPGESVSEFAFQVKELSAMCKFGNFLDSTLQDRFTYNLLDPKIKTAVINAKKTSFEACVSEAILIEGANKVASTSSNVFNRLAPVPHGSHRTKFRHRK